MEVHYQCPRCQKPNRHALQPQGGTLRCLECGLEVAYRAEDVQQQSIRHCLLCPSDDLYVRKDFPQKLGLWIVVLGFAASCVTWYWRQVVATFAILFGTAALDLVLYLTFGDVLTCYRCRAEYRGVRNLDQYAGFDLEVHERHRQRLARESQSSPAPARQS